MYVCVERERGGELCVCVRARACVCEREGGGGELCVYVCATLCVRVYVRACELQTSLTQKEGKSGRRLHLKHCVATSLQTIRCQPHSC